MTANRVLNVIITGDSAALQRALGGAGKAGTAAATGLEAASLRMSKAGKAMTSAGKTLTTHVSAPLGLLGAVAVKSSLDFHRSMELIATQAGGTTKEVERMTRAVEDFAASGQTEFGPNDLASALFHIESAGFRGAKAMRALKSSADLAAVGHADLETTTNALVGALKTGIHGAENMRRAIGTLNATVGAGNLRMEDLNAAMGTGFLSSARQVGLSLSDVGAALATLTAQGIPAEVAASRLRMTFSLMAAPTTKAEAALKEIGLSSTSLAKEMRKPDGLVRALGLLREHLHGLSQVQATQVLSDAFGGARSGTTIMALVNNLGTVDERFRSITKHAGDFNEKLRETKQDPYFKLHAALAKAQVSLVKIGDALAPVVVPALQKLAQVVSDLSNAFEDLPSGTKDFAVEAGLAAVALGPLLAVGGNVLKVLGGIGRAANWAAKALGILTVAEEAATVGGAGAAAGGVATAAEGAAAGTAFGTAAGTAAAAALPVAMVAAGTFTSGGILDTLKGHGSKIGEMIGQRVGLAAALEFEKEFGHRLDQALAGENPFNLQHTVEALHKEMQWAIDNGAAKTDLRPLSKRFGEIATEMPKVFERAWKDSHRIAEFQIVAMERTFDQLPPRLRQTAIQSMEAMAQAMENRGQLVQGQADRLRERLSDDGYLTGRQLVRRFGRGLAGIASVYDALGGTTGGAINQIGKIVNRGLKQLDQSAVLFKLITGPTQLSNRLLNQLPDLSGFAKARGGWLDAPSRRDSAIGIFGRDEAVLTVHQQPEVEKGLALRKALGMGRFGSLDELFAGVTKPNHFAGGGFAKPELAGPSGRLLDFANAGVDRVWKAAIDYMVEHRQAPRGELPLGKVGNLPRSFQELAKRWQPSHPSWDVWQMGLLLQSMGFDVGQNPHFGGVDHVHTPGSYHYIGRAIDVNWPTGGPTELAKINAVAPYVARFHPKDPLIEDAGTSNQHLHFAYAHGGFLRSAPRFGSGGRLVTGSTYPGGAALWRGSAIDRTFPKADGFGGNDALPGYVIKALAESFGMPGETMYRISLGESSGEPGMDASDPAPGDPGARARGLWAINSAYHGGSSAFLRNPVNNAKVAAAIGGRHPNIGIWHAGAGGGGWNDHFHGDVEAIARHVGGAGKGGRGAGHKKRHPHTGGLLAPPKTAKGPTTVPTWQISKEGGVQVPGGYKPGTTIGNLVSGLLPPLGHVKLPASVKGLPASIRSLLHTPGLSFSDVETIAEQAITVAGATPTSADDVAAYKFKLDLDRRRKRRDQRLLNQIRRRLSNRRISPRERKRLLGQQSALISDLGSVESDIVSDRSSLRDARGADTADLTQAIKELTAELKRNSDLAEKEMAVGLVEAKRALADMISGEIGPRAYQGALAAGIGTVGSS